MRKIVIHPRPISQGELAELKRLQQWAAKRNQISGVKPNRNTMAFKPPGYGTGSEWSAENQ